MRLIVSLSLILLAINSFAEVTTKNVLVAGCKVYNMGGLNIRNFPGSMCLFLDNGSFVSANENGIRLFNKNNEMEWEVKGHFHHQINFAANKGRILTLSSELHEVNGKKLRQDKIMIFDLKGQKVSEKLALDMFQESGTEKLNWPPDNHMEKIFPDGEISHFNSIYEIPENKRESKLPFLKSGNIIVNGLETGVFILTPDLSKIVQQFTFKDSILHSVHDVQVTPEGHYLYFSNASGDVQNKNALKHPNWRAFLTLHSSVMEKDPKTFQTIHSMESNPRELFYSKACGSVQEVGKDQWLITHMINGTYLYSKKVKKILYSTSMTHLEGQQFRVIQQVKVEDLSRFLSAYGSK